MKNDAVFQESDFNSNVAREILVYAERIAKRGWVCNTLGNIAVRVRHTYDTLFGIIYTKHRGVSLEEMALENIVVTDVRKGTLLYGTKKPSIGHQLNRAVFRHRPDINAVIHLHVNSVLAYFSATGKKKMEYISDDAALVLGRPVHILNPEINVEKDASKIGSFISETNCFIMPNHGTTTLGRDVSEAYHRMCTLVAEIERIILAQGLALLCGGNISWVQEEEANAMYLAGEGIIYGDT